MAENTKNVGVKFYKGLYGKGDDRHLPNVKGAIIFNEDEQIIYVNGKPYGGASSVDFAGGILTINYSDGRDPQKLDFNDTASASATYHVFERIDNLIGPNINVANGDGKLNYSGTNYLTEETTLVGADRALDAAIKAVDTRIDNMDVASNTVSGTNVHVTYKQEDGKVTVESVTEDYATLNRTEYVKQQGVEGQEGYVAGVSPNLSIKDGDEGKLLKASDTTTIKNYVDDRVNKLGDETKEAFNNLKAEDVQAVTLTEATETTGAKLVFNGVKEENGIISAGALTSELDLALVATSGAAEDVTTTGIGAHTTGEGEEATTTYDIVAGNVQGVLETLNTKINKLNTSSTLHLKQTTAEGEVDAETVSADGTEYKLYQGEKVVAKFNIEKDSFVKEGKVVRGSLDTDGTFTQSNDGEYFIHLVINTHDANTGATAEENIYVPAESLVDAYTANNKHTEGEGESAKEVDNNVTIAINNTNNTISATIKAAGVGTTELADGAVTFAKIATANVQDGTTTSTLLTTKTYVDEKSAESKTTISDVDDSLLVTKTVESDGHSNYEFKLVWIEWEDSTTTPSTEGTQDETSNGAQ